ncbi:MAG: tRNA (adenosine(37)-N6)-dimethylallyltransferase MiaA [Muribaculaceae bacterium]|nr:tRNA (adenosine(37)-N6)-dimethylallyltransferase MiaA [Muribaculaceae bacterium]
MTRPTLVVITGPTASGKTSLSIDVARRLGCEIISADSRQLFRDLPIGTAAPTTEELAAVPHHLVGTLSLSDYYSAARFEEDALSLLPDIFNRSGGYAVVCGGSMMYVDALVNGIDIMPTVSADVRAKLTRLAEEQGSEGLLALLEIIDPEYYMAVDKQNTKRIVHALEISMQAGVPYSTLRTGTKAIRPFDIKKIAIELPRETLFDRINRRVDAMIANGIVEEAKSVYHLRHLNSLNTVGYKELFEYFDGTMDLDTAIARIKKNTRVYAKKQMTWLKRDESVIRLKAPVSAEDVISLL